MGLANFSPAPMSLCSLRPVWMRTTRSSILCLISRVQKELNEHEVWGRGEQGGVGAQLFPQVPSKRLVKDCIVYSTPESWPGGIPLIQNHPCTILAGSRSLWRLGLLSKLWLSWRRSQDCHTKSEAGSKCPVLPMSSVCSAQCQPSYKDSNSSNRGFITCRSLIIFAVIRSTWDLFET